MSPSLSNSDKLAVDRTRLALERTMMAWIRTAVSLISFGFAIFKFFQFIRETAPERMPASAIGPHLFAILMILVGLISLTLAWFQHRQQLVALRQMAGPMPYSLASVSASFVGGLGVIALIAVALRW